MAVLYEAGVGKSLYYASRVGFFLFKHFFLSKLAENFPETAAYKVPH